MKLNLLLNFSAQFGKNLILNVRSSGFEVIGHFTMSYTHIKYQRKTISFCITINKTIWTIIINK